MEAEKKASVVSDMGAWAMNVVSSVGIIMANKQLMSSSGYAFGFGAFFFTDLVYFYEFVCIHWRIRLFVAATTLTGFHFAVTAIVGLVSNATGLSSAKHIPFWELLWFSIVANTSITGMNFSLMLNSVGFYQVILSFYSFFATLQDWREFMTDYLSSLITDFEAQHDSSRLCYGMDSSQQTLLQTSKTGCCSRSHRRWCLHRYWCQSKCKRFYMCLSSRLVYIFPADCKSSFSFLFIVYLW